MIYQPAFEVPAEIAAKVATGDYILWGGVVRDTAGRIVKHLKPIELQEASEAALTVGQRVARFAKSNPVLVAIGVAAVALGGVFAYRKIAALQSASVDEIDSSELNSALSAYVEALRDGDLNVAVVDNLIHEIEKLEAITDTGAFTIEFDGDQLKTLVSSIRDYTEELIKGNAPRLVAADVPMPISHDDSLLDLKDCLLTQKVILKAA